MNKNDKEKKIRSSKTISEKYEIIMHYEKLVKENKVQCPKVETIKHFKLKQTSSLNTILAKSCEIKKSFIENQASETRMRFKNSKYEDIDDELYSYFLKMREKKAQINTNDLKSKALEIGVGKGYDRFNSSNGFIRCFKNRNNIHEMKLKIYSMMLYQVKVKLKIYSIKWHALMMILYPLLIQMVFLIHRWIV
jgi:hypothetical protein